MIDRTESPLLCLLAQLAPEPGQEQANAERASRLIREHPEVGLAVFPEFYLEGYTPGVHRGVGPAAAAALATICAAARAASTAVIVGLAGTEGDGRTSAAACIDERGVVVATSQKVRLFDAESASLVSGTASSPVLLAGHRIGIMICFDMEFPELARRQALDGATLLVSVAANMAPYVENHRLHSRARALENELPHLYVNRVGVEGDLQFVGGTRAVDAQGEIHTEAVGAEEDVLLVAVPSVEHPYPEQLNYLEGARQFLVAPPVGGMERP